MEESGIDWLDRKRGLTPMPHEGLRRALAPVHRQTRHRGRSLRVVKYYVHFTGSNHGGEGKSA